MPDSMEFRFPAMLAYATGSMVWITDRCSSAHNANPCSASPGDGADVAAEEVAIAISAIEEVCTASNPVQIGVSVNAMELAVDADPIGRTHLLSCAA
jgi:hypothetical protein